MTGSERLWPVSDFEVTVRAGVSAPVRRYTTRSIAEIAAEVGTVARPLFVDIDAVLRRGGQQDVSLGEMLLWLNAHGLAWVRLLEHCEHSPRDPMHTGLPGEVGGFLDETECPFAVCAAETITAEQAALVLDYWLDCGDRLPKLVWV
jgi:hypothetical protein